MMFTYYHGLGDWAWVGMVATMAVFWALVVLGAVLAARHLSGTRSAASSPSTATPAERLLADRLARGEIDGAEYNERLSVLRRQVG